MPIKNDLVTKGNLSMLDKDELEDMILQLHRRTENKGVIWGMLRRLLNKGLGDTKWRV